MIKDMPVKEKKAVSRETAEMLLGVATEVLAKQGVEGITVGFESHVRPEDTAFDDIEIGFYGNRGGLEYSVWVGPSDDDADVIVGQAYWWDETPGTYWEPPNWEPCTLGETTQPLSAIEVVVRMLEFGFNPHETPTVYQRKQLAVKIPPLNGKHGQPWTREAAWDEVFDHPMTGKFVKSPFAVEQQHFLHAIFGAVQTSDWKGPMFIADEAMPVDSDGVDLTPFVLAALTFFHAFPPTRLEMPNGKCGWYSVYAA